MKLSRMPLLAWLNLVHGRDVILAVSPLTAAQIMLSIDRYLGGHFFDTQAGGLCKPFGCHFFWIFGASGKSTFPDYSGPSPFASEIPFPVFSRQTRIFG